MGEDDDLKFGGVTFLVGLLLEPGCTTWTSGFLAVSDSAFSSS